MARNVFPFEDDREIILGFLEGKRSNKFETSIVNVNVKDGMLYLTGFHATPILYYSSDGAVMSGLVNTSFEHNYITKVVNHVLELFGDEARIRRETTTVDQDIPPVIQWFLGDQPITPGVNFQVVGPMSLAAWRASRGVKPRRVR